MAKFETHNKSKALEHAELAAESVPDHVGGGEELPDSTVYDISPKFYRDCGKNRLTGAQIKSLGRSPKALLDLGWIKVNQESTKAG